MSRSTPPSASTSSTGRACTSRWPADNAAGYTTLETCSGGVPQQATFDDTLVSTYYDEANNPQNSVKVAGEGVKATVKSVDGTSRNMLVDVTY